MLPHVRDRPLALQAFPNGIDAQGFFMKSVPNHFPDWIATVEVPKRGGSLTQVLAHDAATLVYLAGPERDHPAHLALARGPAARARPPDHRPRPVAGGQLRRGAGGRPGRR